MNGWLNHIYIPCNQYPRKLRNCNVHRPIYWYFPDLSILIFVCLMVGAIDKMRWYHSWPPFFQLNASNWNPIVFSSFNIFKPIFFEYKLGQPSWIIIKLVIFSADKSSLSVNEHVFSLSEKFESIGRLKISIRSSLTITGSFTIQLSGS